MSEDKEREDISAPKESKPEWLVMVYMAGDNALSANCIAILQELEAACPPNDVRVVACFDSNTPRPRGARYVEINYRRHNYPHANINWDLHNDLVPFECLPGHPVEAPDFCNEDETCVEPTTEPVAMEGLSRFIGFALSRHRAKRHMLILFGHGSAVAGNTFLADNTPPSFLRLKEFRQVLTRHFEARPHPLSPAEDDDPPDENLTEEELRSRPPLDILACDNCMMNGIESAYEIRRRVKFVIGSQGLVLALGWPFRKIIEEVVCHKEASTRFIAQRILRVCARNLLDFSLMDRSSEQSLCDLTTFFLKDEAGRKRDLVTAVRNLSRVLKKGLEIDKETQEADHMIRDAIRMARLEAQSFWSETFVDLYDFCMLLLDKCNDHKTLAYEIILEPLLKNATTPEECSAAKEKASVEARALEIMETFGAIAHACNQVLKALKAGRDRFVCESYYIGPELQYSNGVSIYFPWTLPEAPIIFEDEYGGGGSSYNLSWVRFGRTLKSRARALMNNPSLALESPTDLRLLTAFDEYKTYEFAGRYGGDWADFLTTYFRTTLRNVRRLDFKYVRTDRADLFFDREPISEPPFLPSSPIDLQKSSSDVDSETDCSCPTIKNYPRRFYLSPVDCRDRCRVPGADTCSSDTDTVAPTPPEEICVSYLGWNIRGIVSDVIDLNETKPTCSDAADDEPDDEPEK